jgi:hypothetical protein
MNQLVVVDAGGFDDVGVASAGVGAVTVVVSLGAGAWEQGVTYQSGLGAAEPFAGGAESLVLVGEGCDLEAEFMRRLVLCAEASEQEFDAVADEWEDEAACQDSDEPDGVAADMLEHSYAQAACAVQLRSRRIGVPDQRWGSARPVQLQAEPMHPQAGQPGLLEAEVLGNSRRSRGRRRCRGRQKQPQQVAGEHFAKQAVMQFVPCELKEASRPGSLPLPSKPWSMTEASCGSKASRRRQLWPIIL